MPWVADPIPSGQAPASVPTGSRWIPEPLPSQAQPVSQRLSPEESLRRESIRQLMLRRPGQSYVPTEAEISEEMEYRRGRVEPSMRAVRPYEVPAPPPPMERDPITGREVKPIPFWQRAVIGRTIPGMISERFTGRPWTTPEEESRVGRAGEIVLGVGSLVADPMTYAAFGPVARLAKAGLSRLAASKLLQHMGAGAAGFGAFDVAREGARQIGEGEFQPEELAKAGGHGLALGGAIGAIGVGSDVLARALGRLSPKAAKYGIPPAKFAAETAAFGTGSPLLEGREPTQRDIEDAALFLGTLKGLGMAGRIPGKIKETRKTRATKVEARKEAERIKQESLSVPEEHRAEFVAQKTEELAERLGIPELAEPSRIALQREMARRAEPEAWREREQRQKAELQAKLPEMITAWAKRQLEPIEAREAEARHQQDIEFLRGLSREAQLRAEQARLAESKRQAELAEAAIERAITEAELQRAAGVPVPRSIAERQKAVIAAARLAGLKKPPPIPQESKVVTTDPFIHPEEVEAAHARAVEVNRRLEARRQAEIAEAAMQRAATEAELARASGVHTPRSLIEKQQSVLAAARMAGMKKPPPIPPEPKTVTEPPPFLPPTEPAPGVIREPGLPQATAQRQMEPLEYLARMRLLQTPEEAFIRQTGPFPTKPSISAPEAPGVAEMAKEAVKAVRGRKKRYKGPETPPEAHPEAPTEPKLPTPEPSPVARLQPKPEGEIPPPPPPVAKPAEIAAPTPAESMRQIGEAVEGLKKTIKERKRPTAEKPVETKAPTISEVVAETPKEVTAKTKMVPATARIRRLSEVELSDAIRLSELERIEPDAPASLILREAFYGNIDAVLKRLSKKGLIDLANDRFTKEGLETIAEVKRYHGMQKNRPVEFEPELGKASKPKAHFVEGEGEPTGRVHQVLQRFTLREMGRIDLTGVQLTGTEVRASDGRRLISVPIKTEKTGLFDELGREIEATFPNVEPVMGAALKYAKRIGITTPDALKRVASAPRRIEEKVDPVVRFPTKKGEATFKASFIRDVADAFRDLGIQRIEVLVNEPGKPIVFREAGAQKPVVALVMPLYETGSKKLSSAPYARATRAGFEEFETPVKGVKERALKLIRENPDITPADFIERMADAMPPDQALALHTRLKRQLGVWRIRRRDLEFDWIDEVVDRAVALSKDPNSAKITRIAIDQARKAGKEITPKTRATLAAEAAREAAARGSTEPGLASKFFEIPGRIGEETVKPVEYRFGETEKMLREVGISFGAFPTKTIIRKTGKPGELFINEAILSVDVPAAKAGEFMLELDRAVRASFGEKGMNADQMFNLKEAIEGRQKPTPEVEPVYRKAKELLTVVKNLKLSQDPDIKMLENYFRHSIPHVDELKKGKMRNAIIEDVVKRGTYQTREEATKALDEYIEARETADFIERRLKSEDGSREVKYLEQIQKEVYPKLNRYLSRMVREGLAEDLVDAALKFRYFVETQPRARYGAFRERTANLPWYNPNPIEALWEYFQKGLRDIYLAERFGKDFKDFINLADKIDAALRMDYAPAREVYEYYLGMTPPQRGGKISRRIGTVEIATKMSMSAIPNLFQGPLGSAYRGNVKSVFGAWSDLTKLDMTAKDWTKMVGQNPSMAVFAIDPYSSGLAQKALRLYGHSKTEVNNYIIATVTGRYYTNELAKRLVKDPTNETLRRQVKEIGLNPEKIIDQGGASILDLEVASARFWRESQAIPDILNQPHRWFFMKPTDPAARVLRQFQTTAYAQAVEVVRGILFRKGQRVANLIKLTVMYPIVGEIIQDIKALIGLRKRPENLLLRYLDNMQAAFAFGIIGDMIAWHRYGIGFGPAVSDIMDIYNVAVSPSRLPEEALERVPFVGRGLGQMVREERLERAKKRRREERERKKRWPD